MADTNTTRRVDHLEFLDDDPFAELTRIMGHDPRAADAEPRQDEAAPSGAGEDDFDISLDLDLEKELMGDLDFSDFDEPDQSHLTGHLPDAGTTSGDEWSAEFSAEPIPEQESEAWSPEPSAWEAGVADPVSQELAEEALALPDFPSAEPVSDPSSTSDFDFELFDALTAEIDRHPAEAEATSPDELDAWTGEEAVYETPAEAVLPQEAFAAGAPSYAMPLDAADEAQDQADFEDEAPFLDAAGAQDMSGDPWFSVNEPTPELSLEDELTALLSQDAAPAEPAYEPEPVVEAEAAPSTVPVWHSSSEIFGRANFAAGRRDAFEDEAPGAAQAMPEQAPAAESDDFADMFASLELDIDSGPEMGQAPDDAAPQDVLPPGDDAHEDGAHVDDEQALPEIATIEIVDAAATVDDDLDIPEVEYGTAPAPRPYDDLESQFEDVFGDVALDEPVPAAPPQAPAEPVAAIAAAAAPAAVQETWHEQPFADDDFDYEQDLERAIAETAYEDEAGDNPSGRRRLMIAGAVVAVAVIAGAGMLGMSFFGDDAGAPALVRADTDPLKVRPENPGGATVPNQDNEVYQRVQAGESDAAPQQESLITTVEEPLDVAAAETLPPPATGIAGEAGDPAATTPKAEDRIEPATDDAAALGALEDSPVVTPRRVRTMVVRPDGTLVPREEIEPAAAPAPLAEPAPAADATPMVAALPGAGAALDTIPQAPGDTALAQPAETLAEEDEGPVVDTPQTVAVVPTPRAEAPAARTAAPVAQAPAATPVSAPAAAAPAVAAAADGAWSMQIASQPTAEGAQATYQDLARRYGGVLQGRGVNIVRADIEGMGTYYRVRIPAATRDDAIELCTRYKSAGGSCFVSR